MLAFIFLPVALWSQGGCIDHMWVPFYQENKHFPKIVPSVSTFAPTPSTSWTSSKVPSIRSRSHDHSWIPGILEKNGRGMCLLAWANHNPLAGRGTLLPQTKFGFQWQGRRENGYWGHDWQCWPQIHILSLSLSYTPHHTHRDK